MAYDCGDRNRQIFSTFPTFNTLSLNQWPQFEKLVFDFFAFSERGVNTHLTAKLMVNCIMQSIVQCGQKDNHNGTALTAIVFEFGQYAFDRIFSPFRYFAFSCLKSINYTFFPFQPFFIRKKIFFSRLFIGFLHKMSEQKSYFAMKRWFAEKNAMKWKKILQFFVGRIWST